MAKLNSTGNEPLVANMMATAENVIAKNKQSIQQSNMGKVVIGAEGYTSPEQAVNRDNAQATIVTALTTGLNKLSVGAESVDYTPAQLEAGAIIASAVDSPVEYAAVAMNPEFGALAQGQADASVILGGGAGNYDTNMPSIGAEYFNDEEVLRKNMAASLVFNVQAARQDEFGEEFFPTIVADPTEAGLLIEIKKTVVHRAVRHALKPEDSKPFNRRNILDAATDASVLEDDAIALVPYFMENGSTDAEFMPASLKTPTEREVGDYTVRTNPLRFTGKRRNLLALSAHPGLVSTGFLDESDDIAGRVVLKRIYLEVLKKGDANKQAVSFETANLPRSTYNPSQEGDEMEHELSFRNATFALNGAKKDIVGADVAAFEELGALGYTLKFTTTIRSALNLQTGEEQATLPLTDIVGLYDQDGNGISIKEGKGKDIVDKIEFAVTDYEYDIYRSNANRRTKGLLVDTVGTHERFKILLGSPITSRKPIGRTDNSAAVSSLITAARLRNSNQAVTKLLNYSEQLKEVVKTIVDPYELVSIEGVGRHHIMPWYDEVEFLPTDRISNTDTQNVSGNLASGILATLREQCARGFMESRFQPALEMISGYTVSKPSVLIGTDPYTANWLWEKGDVRTLGDQFEYKIVTTNDFRFRGRIQWVFKVSQGENGICPLNFGNHLWIPELITDTNLTRNEGTANEITVQPRNLHIVHCPITGVINVTAIKDFINTKPSLSVATVADTTSALDDTVLDGLDAKA